MLSASDEFISKNKAKYEIISSFQNQLNYLTEDTYPIAIQFVKDHSDVFFKDHASAICFLNDLTHFSISNFKQFEHILDIGIYFSNELKKVNITEFDIIGICHKFLNSINYLFVNNFISFESIFLQSNPYPELFIMFLPEIMKFDPEYVELRIKDFFDDEQNQYLLPFYEIIKKDPEQHIQNRNQNYHPSILHKAIRDDDIETFQKLISQNNYDINYQFDTPEYDRAIKLNLAAQSLIQVAAQYGSIQIFKFLWVQNGIILDDDLLKYSFFGRNIDIIHICETKCKFNNAINTAIKTHQNGLVDYCIDKFSDQMIEDNEGVKEALMKFKDNDENNPYKNLTYESLQQALTYSNLKIIIPCIPKILYIIENVEKNNFMQFFQQQPTLLDCSLLDFEMFKFFYSHKNNCFQFSNCDNMPYIRASLQCANDSLKYIMKNENPSSLYHVFFFFLQQNYDMANYVLNNQIKNRNEGKLDELYNYFSQKVSFDVISIMMLYFYEEITVKIIRLYFPFDNDVFQSNLVQMSIQNISKRMIISLIKELSKYYPEVSIQKLVLNYSLNGFPNIFSMLSN